MIPYLLCVFCNCFVEMHILLKGHIIISVVVHLLVCPQVIHLLAFLFCRNDWKLLEGTKNEMMYWTNKHFEFFCRHWYYFYCPYKNYCNILSCFLYKKCLSFVKNVFHCQYIFSCKCCPTLAKLLSKFYSGITLCQ